MSNVPVPQEHLNAWARFADRVRNAMFPIDLHITRRQYAQASEALAELHHHAAAALSDMERAGAETGELLPPPPVPLHLLDTPANRRLARALREAYEAAVEVDKERDTYMEGEPEDGPAALPIVELLVRVEEECFGPMRERG